MEFEHKGYTVLIEKSPDNYQGGFVWSISKNGEEIDTDDHFSIEHAADSAKTRIDMLTSLKGLFVYDASRYSSPIVACANGALNCVDGWGIQIVPTLGAMQNYINVVAKTLTFTASPYTVVYVAGGQFTSDMGEKYLGASLHEFPKLFVRPDFFEKSE